MCVKVPNEVSKQEVQNQKRRYSDQSYQNTHNSSCLEWVPSFTAIRVFRFVVGGAAILPPRARETRNEYDLSEGWLIPSECQGEDDANVQSKA